MENRPNPISIFTRVKCFIGRSLDIFGWFFLRRSSVKFHHWGTRDVTNKGDIAIREAIKDNLKSLFAPHPVEFTELHWGELTPVAAADISRNHDLFVIGGSGYIASDESGNISPRADQDLASIAEIKCPKIAFGIGWNKHLATGDFNEPRPLSHRARETLKSTLRQLDLVSVRDAATQALVSELLGRPPLLGGDPALFYGGSQSRRKFTDGKLHVGLNFALHGKERAGFIAQQHKIFCDVLAEFAHRHDVMYHYMQHAYTERGVPLMLRARGISVIREDLPVDQMLSLYRVLDLHICQMLHSAILAVNAGTPTLHYGYDVKSLGFFVLMQMSEVCHPDWPLDDKRMLADLEAILTNSQRIRTHIVERKKQVKQHADAFLEMVKEVVINGPL
jgi:polysaccharide pyruvyl transferase WcaK-like protein